MINSKKGFLLIPLLLVIAMLSPLGSERGEQDWKEAIGKYLKKAREYDKMAVYLEQHIDRIPVFDRPNTIICLSYACRRMGDQIKEKKWITRYFENFRNHQPELNFLPAKERVKVFEYINRWQHRYPGVKTIRVSESSRRLNFFVSYNTFAIDIDALAPSEITILNKQGDILYAGFLDKGFNTVPLPFEPLFKKQRRNLLEIRLSNESIHIRKRVRILARYHFPDRVEFDPENGKIKIKGKSFKEEKTKKTVRQSRRYFDKKHFMKKALLPMSIGCGLLLMNRLAIHPQVNKETSSAGNRAFMKGLDKTSLVVSVGFSLKGMAQIFKSYKREQSQKEIWITHADAATYNKALRQEMDEVRKKIAVTYTIIKVVQAGPGNDIKNETNK